MEICKFCCTFAAELVVIVERQLLLRTWSGLRSDYATAFLCFIAYFRENLGQKYAKNTKKCKKMKKNCKKICIYQKFVVILHRQLKMTQKNTNK